MTIVTIRTKNVKLLAKGFRGANFELHPRRKPVKMRFMTTHDQPEDSNIDPIEDDVLPDDVIDGAAVDDVAHEDPPEASEDGLDDDIDMDDASDDVPSDPLSAAIDVDAALASIADLSEALTIEDSHQPPPPSDDVDSYDYDYDDEGDEQPEYVAEPLASDHYFPRPPEMVMERGRLLSVIPALALIVGGALWTFALTTAETPPEAGIVVLVIVAVFGVISLVYWLAIGRWSFGAIFTSVTLFAALGLLIFLAQSAELQADGAALLLVAPGLGMAMASFLAQPPLPRARFTGFVLIAAGLAGFAFMRGITVEDTRAITSILLPVIGVILLILLAAPIAARR